MARTDNLRNVVLVVCKVGTTWNGRGVEVQTDGTLVLGTAKTSTVGKDDLLKQLVGTIAAGSFTPENSALYSTDDVAAVVQVREQAASGSLGNIFPG
jgi:hypothetical protein